MLKFLVLPVFVLVFLTGQASPSQACACCGTWQVVNVKKTDVLNIRSGPGAHYTIVGTIPSGAGCVLKSGQCEKNWCRIGYSKTVGWVNNYYLRYMEVPTN